MGPRNILFAVVLGSALAAGIYIAAKNSQPPQPRMAFVIPEPAPLPEFSLLDQYGKRVSRDVFRGQWDLVFFGFTHCPDICPTTLQVLSTAKQQLAAEGLVPLPRIVLVSVDPERDSPELLGQYVGNFGDGNLGITGELEEIRKLASGPGIFFEKAQMDDGNYSVDHSAVVLLIDPDGKFSALFSGPHTVAAYVHDLPLVMDAR